MARQTSVMAHLHRCMYWYAAVVTILLLSIFGRGVQQIVFTRINAYVLSGAVFVVLLLLLFFLWRRRGAASRSRLTLPASVALLAIGATAVYFDYLAPIEAVHFLVFSWLGWLSAGVFQPLAAFAAVVGVSVGDEVLQYYLPSRVGDLHDVAINCISGICGLIIRRKW